MSVDEPDAGDLPEPTPGMPEHLRGDHGGKAILRKCWKRMNRRNMHYVMCLVGREGAGKSLTAIQIARLLDPSFTADKVIFRPETLLEMLRDEEYQRGDVFVFDEAGVALGNRTWADAEQRRFNQALQLIRDHNIGLIFTLPRLGELDSQAQGRLQAYFEIRQKKDGEYVRGPWLWLDPDRADITGKIYRKKPRYDGAKVASVAFEPPGDDELVARYEERKTDFQREVYEQVLEQYDDEDEDDLSPQDVAEKIRNNGGVEQYVREINGGTQTVLDADMIANDYDLGGPRSKRVKKLLLDDVEGEVL